MFGILAFAEGAFAELTITGNVEIAATGVNATGGTGALSAQGTTLIIPSSVTGTTSVGDETIVINVAIATTTPLAKNKIIKFNNKIYKNDIRPIMIATITLRLAVNVAVTLNRPNFTKKIK